MKDEWVEQELRELAQKHYEFLERWIRKTYLEAFIHGYKHGKELRKFK